MENISSCVPMPAAARREVVGRRVRNTFDMPAVAWQKVGGKQAAERCHRNERALLFSHRVNDSGNSNTSETNMDVWQGSRAENVFAGVELPLS